MEHGGIEECENVGGELQVHKMAEETDNLPPLPLNVFVRLVGFAGAKNKFAVFLLLSVPDVVGCLVFLARKSVTVCCVKAGWVGGL